MSVKRKLTDKTLDFLRLSRAVAGSAEREYLDHAIACVDAAYPLYAGTRDPPGSSDDEQAFLRRIWNHRHPIVRRVFHMVFVYEGTFGNGEFILDDPGSIDSSMAQLQGHIADAVRESKGLVWKPELISILNIYPSSPLKKGLKP